MVEVKWRIENRISLMITSKLTLRLKGDSCEAFCSQHRTSALGGSHPYRLAAVDAAGTYRGLAMQDHGRSLAVSAYMSVANKRRYSRWTTGP
jgi:hypothetical protein